uniref:Uncharacterized protein n=1 Tax=Bracon brevicornis TaxID=1563983 RepID=A0A6V7IW39_9HYME
MTTKPNVHQAIIIDKIIEANVGDHIVALLEVIPGEKILNAFILSDNRIVVFLDSEQTVDDLIVSKKHIVVSQQIVKIRPYITRKKRIIFNEVFPHVDDSFLEDELKKIGIQILEPVKTLSANFQQEELKHIMSLRRETYIALEDIEKLPKGIVIIDEDEEIYIPITIENSISNHSSGEESDHLMNGCPLDITQFIVNKPADHQQ